MILKVEIDKEQAKIENVVVRSGNKNGRDWEIRTQQLYVFANGERYPQKVDYVLSDEVKVYPSGEYTLDLNEGFQVGNFNSIFLNTRKLMLKPASNPKS